MVDISLALPAYNEAENICRVVSDSVAALQELEVDWEILVIDNNSSDATPDLVDALADEDERIRLIRHEENRQYSGSCATALEAAKGDIVVIMDSDGQALATDIPKFVAEIEAGSNIVFGWREHRHDPAARLAMSWVFNAMGKLYLRYPHHDLNCGYRAFDRTFVEETELRHRINLANPELYVRAVLGGLRVGEVAVEHKPRLGGGSSHDFRRIAKVFLDVNRYLRALRTELRSASTDVEAPVSTPA